MAMYGLRPKTVKAFQIGTDEVPEQFSGMGNKGDFIVIDNGNVEVYSEQDFHNKFVGIW